MHCVSPVYSNFESMLAYTLDNVYSSWTRVVSGNGLASMDLTESRHQVVGFVGRSVFIEPVDLQVIVIVMRAALETSLRTFDVLLTCVSVCSMLQKSLKSYFVRHIEDVRDSWSSLVLLYDYDFSPFYPLARITRHEVQCPSPNHAECRSCVRNPSRVSAESTASSNSYAVVLACVLSTIWSAQKSSDWLAI